MNEAIQRGQAPWVLLLNPDARPAPDYVDRLLRATDEGALERRARRGSGHRPAAARRGQRRSARARRLRHATHPHLASSRPRLGTRRPRPAAGARASVRRYRRRVALSPRRARGRRDRRPRLRRLVPLLPRGRRALLPAAGARLGRDLRAARPRHPSASRRCPRGAASCRPRSTSIRSRTAICCASTIRPRSTWRRRCPSRCFATRWRWAGCCCASATRCRRTVGCGAIDGRCSIADA